MAFIVPLMLNRPSNGVGFDTGPARPLSVRAQTFLAAASVVVWVVVGVLLPLLTMQAIHNARTTPVPGTVTSVHHVRVADDCSVKTCLAECGEDTCYLSEWATTVTVDTPVHAAVTVNRHGKASVGSTVTVFHAADGGWHGGPSSPMPTWLVWGLFNLGAALVCGLMVAAAVFVLI